MKNVLQKTFLFLKWLIVSFLVSTIGVVLCYKWIPVAVTPLMIIRCVENFKNDDTVAIHHQWVPLDKMSKNMPLAVVASEDQNFLKHHGFDFTAIEKAIEENKEGKRQRGASTISQQTAKNVFLWPASSWTRKALETYFTVLIELMWSKERIMEVYLNSIEMGPNIYGVEAVAQRYFGCPASELRHSDCALIAATLPNPLRYSSFAPSRYMRQRQKAIRKQMKLIGEIRWEKSEKK